MKSIILPHFRKLGHVLHALLIFYYFVLQLIVCGWYFEQCCVFTFLVYSVFVCIWWANTITELNVELILVLCIIKWCIGIHVVFNPPWLAGWLADWLIDWWIDRWMYRWIDWLIFRSTIAAGSSETAVPTVSDSTGKTCTACFVYLNQLLVNLAPSLSTWLRICSLNNMFLPMDFKVAEFHWRSRLIDRLKVHRI